MANKKEKEIKNNLLLDFDGLTMWDEEDIESQFVGASKDGNIYQLHFLVGKDEITISTSNVDTLKLYLYNMASQNNIKVSQKVTDLINDLMHTYIILVKRKYSEKKSTYTIKY